MYIYIYNIYIYMHIYVCGVMVCEAENLYIIR